MIVYRMGDLLQSDAQTLANPVNTVGVMGKGLAAQFKAAYPAMFDEYRALCENGQLSVGKLHLYKGPQKWILNFPTKTLWRSQSKVEDIEAGLKRFVDIYEPWGITSVAFPKLGSGLGGLDWDAQVHPLMHEHLNPLPIEVQIYARAA